MTIRITTIIVLSATLAVATAALAADREPPPEWDWRDVDGFDYVSPVRNTGSCGSSFILAPIGVIEARYRIEVARLGGTPPPIDLSDQHVMDCGSGWYGDFGCNGGYAKDVFEHVRDNGVPREVCYEYVGVEQECPTDCPDSPVPLELVWPVDEVGELRDFPDSETIRLQVYDHGPVATVMDLYGDFNSYSSGVYQHIDGTPSGASVVMIVGWGEAGGVPYWICRNVWGEGWGDSGDFLIVDNAEHAGCDFGESVWWCTIDTANVPSETTTMDELKRAYR